MVLDSIVNGEFVFKNTHRDNVKVKLPVAAPEAPMEFFFVHIKVKENKVEQIKHRLAMKPHKHRNYEPAMPQYGLWYLN